MENFEKGNYASIKEIPTKNEEIETLKTKIAQNTREVLNLEEENKNLTGKRHNLNNKTEEFSNSIRNLETQLESKKGDITNLEQRLLDLEAKIHQMDTEQEKFKEDYKKFEFGLVEEYSKREKYANSFENSNKAMKLLVKKNYIKTPQVQLINALQVGTELDLDSILKANDIKMEVATKILRKIVELGGPVEFKEAAKKVILETEVDFK
ncbi:MAG: hypothetical protein ACTSRK_18650 [Promethearchaeota archaeon]